MEYIVLGALIAVTAALVFLLIRGKRVSVKKAVLISAVALTCCAALLIGGSMVLFPRHDHQLVIVEKVLPTCTEAGYIVYDCDGCDEEDYTGVIAKKPHAFGEWEITKEPSCAPGEQKRTCTDCGFVQVEEIRRNQPHELGPWVTVRVATCANQGLEQAVCRVCGAVQENIIPMKPCTW